MTQLLTPLPHFVFVLYRQGRLADPPDTEGEGIFKKTWRLKKKQICCNWHYLKYTVYRIELIIDVYWAEHCRMQACVALFGYRRNHPVSHVVLLRLQNWNWTRVDTAITYKQPIL